MKKNSINSCRIFLTRDIRDFPFPDHRVVLERKELVVCEEMFGPMVSSESRWVSEALPDGRMVSRLMANSAPFLSREELKAIL